MTIDMTIGEYTKTEEDDYIWESARRERLAEAPTFPGDSFTGNSNYRSAGYSGWDGFVGRHPIIEDLMYGTGNGAGPLIPEHPGIADLKQPHLEAAIQALLDHVDKLGDDVLPGYRPTEEEIKSGITKLDPAAAEGMKYDYDLVRLHWMVWWMTWALRNCKRPVYANH